MGNLITVTVTEGGTLLTLLIPVVSICLSVTDISLFPRFTPVTLTPFTLLMPTVPESDEPLNKLFVKGRIDDGEVRLLGAAEAVLFATNGGTV
jgi:hypothetical protein